MLDMKDPDWFNKYAQELSIECRKLCEADDEDYDELLRKARNAFPDTIEEMRVPQWTDEAVQAFVKYELSMPDMPPGMEARIIPPIPRD